MNTFLRKLVPGLLLFCLLGATATAQTRVATINLQKVFDKYWKTGQAIASLKARAAEMDKTHKQMLDDLKKSREEYQTLVEEANDQAVSAAERDKRKQAAEDKKKSIDDALDNIAQFEKRASATITEQKGRMRKNILDEIKVAISSKAKSQGYSVVIDSGAQTYVADPSGPYYTPTVLYTSDANDLTDAVIAQLNAGAPVALPGADDQPTNSNGGDE